MIRYIPGRTRVKTEFLKGVTFGDIILAVICLIFAIVIIASNLFKIGGVDYRWYALFAWIGISVVMYLPIDDGLRLWSSITLIIRFSAFAKKYIKSGKQRGYKSMEMLTPFYKTDMGKFIDFGTYSGMVLEIHPIALDLMQEKAQKLYKSVSEVLCKIKDKKCIKYTELCY